jgi:ribosome biogenesis GTPase A
MHKARKELKKIINQVDVVFEIVDARAPEASANPLLHEIVINKPLIKVLSKSDLANNKTTNEWIKFYKYKAIAINILSDKQAPKKLIDLASKAAPHRGSILKPIRAIVIGIPNVGKSTLINALAGRKIAKTGNEPAITKRQDNIIITKTFYLRDTPGIMSPSPKSEDANYKLAACGAIRDTAMDYPSTSYYLIRFLHSNAIQLFYSRYSLIQEDIREASEEELLKKISLQMGTIKTNNLENIHQTAEKLILDFRQGRIGRISLESPASFQDEEKSYITEPSE